MYNLPWAGTFFSRGLLSSSLAVWEAFPVQFIGALLLGLIESVGATFLTYGYKDAIGFLMLGVTLLIRPIGLFGVQLHVQG